MSEWKSVFVTGANGGIGQALISKFINTGYHVIGTDRQNDQIFEHQNYNYVTIEFKQLANDDNYREQIGAEVKNLTQSVVLKGLVHNAAVQHLDRFEELSYSDWKDTMNVNLDAAFLLSKMLIDPLSSQKGAIVHIASIHSELTKPEFVAYATSKSALVGLTKAMAVDIGDRVRVNAICPAAIATDMLVDGFLGKTKEFQALKDYHPSGGIGAPEEVARLAHFLISEDLPFLNGSIIDLAGGINHRLHDPS